VRPLTERQERFAVEVAKGATFTQAYRTAYPASLKYPDRTVWSKGSVMAAHGMVKARIEELRAPALQESQYDVRQAMAETDRYLLLAAEDRAWGPVSAMLTHKAKLNALLLTKIEVGGAGEFASFSAQQKVFALKALQEEIDKRKALEADISDVVDKLEEGGE
jgi:hypothetical protein